VACVLSTEMLGQTMCWNFVGTVITMECVCGHTFCHEKWSLGSRTRVVSQMSELELIYAPIIVNAQFTG